MRNFWKFVEKTTTCWNWTGSKNDSGYGRFCVPNENGYKVIGAHRYLFFQKRPNTNKNLGVLHHCDNPACVRLSHLYAGTSQDNMNDMLNRKGHYQRNKVKCPKGHLYQGKNLYTAPNGDRHCRNCRAKSHKKWRNKQ